MIAEFTAWYGTLGPMMQIFWACAIVASVVFVIQMVLTMLGMDANGVDVGFDVADFSGGGDGTLDAGGSLSLFSIRNLINFFLGFGWAGVSLEPAVGANVWLVLLSTAVGAGFVWLFFYVRRQTMKLESNGAFDISRTLHKSATVYLHIPAQGRGKVQVSEGGSVQELDAVSEGGDDLPSGTLVHITEVIDKSTVRVARS